MPKSEPTHEPTHEPTYEPWLRGVLPGVDAVIGHLIRSSQQIREDLEKALAPLSPSEIWNGTVGFHAKHLAGSTRRLCAYLQGRSLTAEELEAGRHEANGEETAGQLLDAVNKALDLYENEIRSLRPEDFGSLREVGREKLPVTAIGLAIHIAEHGQRHTGQAIEAARRRNNV